MFDGWTGGFRSWRRLRGKGSSPQHLEWGTLIQIVPHNLSCFKIRPADCWLPALQCSKQLTDPMTLTAYSLLLRSTSSTSTNSLFQAEYQHFSGEDTDKNTAQNTPNTPVHVKNFFFWEGLPPPKPHPFSHQAFWIRPCVSPEFQPLVLVPLPFNELLAIVSSKWRS